MRKLFTSQSLTIPTGQAVSGIAKNAQTLRVVSGRVWITMEGVLHDYWLFAGDTFTLVPGLLTVIEADGSMSRIELASTRRQPALLGLGTQLLHLVQRFARSRNAGTPACLGRQLAAQTP